MYNNIPILTEEVSLQDNFQILQEDNGSGEKRMKITGPFIVMDRKNGNKRVYGHEETVPAVENYISEWVNANRAMGELNHPGKPRVNPERACIKIEELVLDDTAWVYNGKAKILRTPLGQLVRILMEDDIRLGVSSRIMGSVNEYTGRVNPGMKVVTASDVVTDPSASDAMVETLMEHREIFDGFGDDANKVYEEFRHDLGNKGRDPVDAILFDFINKVRANL